MQRAQIGPWEIAYDREATQAAYAAGGDCNDYYCGCQGCMNYLANARAFPEEMRQFFDSLGIDPTKPSHLSCAIATSENEYFYDGWYHVIGHQASGEAISFEGFPYHITDDFWVGLASSPIHVPKEIPEEQALQLDFSFSLPWLLTEPKDTCYIYEGD
jgi:hypothetical protein